MGTNLNGRTVDIGDVIVLCVLQGIGSPYEEAALVKVNHHSQCDCGEIRIKSSPDCTQKISSRSDREVFGGVIMIAQHSEVTDVGLKPVWFVPLETPTLKTVKREVISCIGYGGCEASIADVGDETQRTQAEDARSELPKGARVLDPEHHSVAHESHVCINTTSSTSYKAPVAVAIRGDACEAECEQEGEGEREEVVHDGSTRRGSFVSAVLIFVKRSQGLSSQWIIWVTKAKPLP